MSLRQINKLKFLCLALVMTVAVVAPLSNHKANAAALTNTFVRFDRMKISQPTTGTVCAKPATALVEAHVQVTFPTGYTLGASGAFTVTTTNLAWPATATAWLGINTATNVTSQTVTFPSTDLVVGTLYCFNWNSSTAVSVKGSASANNTGTVVTQDSGPATIDTGSYATASVTAPDDQITVTATIGQTFSMAISNAADALGALSSGSVSVSPTPRTATINTNAKNGWYIWANDSNTGLNSATASYTVASTTPGSNSTLSAGTEGYNTGITTSQVGGTGTIVVQAPFVGGLAGKGGGLDTSLRTLAISSGTADTAVVTLTNNAAISGTTPPASDYTDVITVVAAGLF